MKPMTVSALVLCAALAGGCESTAERNLEEAGDEMEDAAEEIDDVDVDVD